MLDQTSALHRTAESDDRACGDEDWARPVMERQLAILGALAEVGLNIARAVEAQAIGAGDAIVRDVAQAYARVSRAVRLTIMLQSDLIRDLQWFDHRNPQARRTAENARRNLKNERKARVERIVARVIDAEHDGEDQAECAERLTGEASERLDDEDFCDVLSLPVSEVVALICRDLGLSPDWARLADEAWAREEIASGKAGSPLAAFMTHSAQTRQPKPTADSFRLAPQAGSP